MRAMETYVKVLTGVDPAQTAEQRSKGQGGDSKLSLTATVLGMGPHFKLKMTVRPASHACR